MMTPHDPPRIAAWLLRRFGRRNDALTGDLLEEYGQGRSAGWYWRQVLMAIAVGRSKEAFLVLGVLALYRIGTLVPVPGTNSRALALLATRGMGGLWKYDWMTGGNLSSVTVFALGLNPYLSAAMIVQPIALIWWFVWRRGDTPWDLPIVRSTWAVAIALSIVQAIGLALFLERQSSGAGGLRIVDAPGWVFRISTVITLTVGSAGLMWMSERITRRGLGNGMFLMFFAAILAGLPGLSTVAAMPLVLGQLVIAFALVGITSHGYRRALEAIGD